MTGQDILIEKDRARREAMKHTRFLQIRSEYQRARAYEAWYILFVAVCVLVVVIGRVCVT
jgi:hypothetical protein